ncbi:MAG: PAS domain-containing sensor histidine kinase, partial [Anaerolineae bacterium]|nr:PAS domain-containing sensor histidine kinase [Anaerolineae bacterium]
PTRFETRLLHARGHVIEVEFNSGVMFLAGHLAMLVIIRDITARKQAEAERERLINELREFAHTVAHDLKSPLHGLIGYASLVADDSTSFEADELQRYLKTIENYGFRMSGIIDDLLLLASVRSLEEVALEVVDMRAVAHDALDRLKFMVQQHGAVVSIAEDIPAVWGYGPWLTQVWVNYLSNALKYGGETPQVELGAGPHPEGMCRFWVRDQGLGLTPEQQGHLFARFSRVGELSIEGHGLGLSIVQRIAERLGGEVGVESAPGQGATFWFTLPTEAEQPAAGAVDDR